MAKGIIQYTKDLVNDSQKSTKTTYSSEKIESLLSELSNDMYTTQDILTEKQIGNSQIINQSDLNLSPNSILKLNTIVYDTNGILGKIESINNTNSTIEVITIHSNLSESLEQNGYELLLGCFDTPPVTFNEGDKYYNTTSKLIFTADATNWNSGEIPTEKIIYLNLDDNKIYAYTNNTFEIYGGSSDIKISNKSDNAIEEVIGSTNPNEDGLYVKDLSGDIDDLSFELTKLNWAQKTVNEVGEFELLDSSVTLNFTPAATQGTTVFTDINQDLTLLDDISNYDYIDFSIRVASSTRKFVTQTLRVKVSEIVFNNSNTLALADGSHINLTYDVVSTQPNAGGEFNLYLQMWFKDSKTLYLFRGYTPYTADYTGLELTSVMGKKEKSVIIDPLEYANETKGIEDTPVGHIMATMANTAPKHYLKCDGTIYNILDYRHLAEHIKAEFGSYNYFGGDGITTFAVPDLSGEFLRGTGTNSHANQGSGANVGEHQDATDMPNYWYDENNVGMSSNLNDTVTNHVTNADSTIVPTGTKINFNNNASNIFPSTLDHVWAFKFTTRPTNTSVLYCIKYEPTYFMKIGEGGGFLKILGCFDTAPTTFSQDDMYYNTIDNKIYNATDSTTWDSGVTPDEEILYLALDNNKIYNYNNGTLEVFGGSETKISTLADNAIQDISNGMQDGLYVKDLSLEVDKLNIAQKTVNKVGSYSLLDSPKSFKVSLGATNGEGVITTINQDIILKDDITNYDSIEIYFAPMGTYELLPQMNKLRVTNNLFSQCNTITCTYNFSTRAITGSQHVSCVCSFVDSKTFHINNIINTVSTTYNEFGIIDIIGINDRSVTIDPMNYIDTTQGIQDTPVGHIISTVGGTTPPHYLPCDGQEYNIADYPYLSEYFKTELGAYNCYGGDGVTTFAVPNIKNTEKLDTTSIANNAWASSIYSSNYLAAKAFNGILDTNSNYWQTVASPSFPVEIGIDLESGYTVKKYVLHSYGWSAGAIDDRPTSWTFEGSINKTDWDILDTQTNHVWTTGKEGFNIPNVRPYRYYRIIITATIGGQESPLLNQVELFVNTENPSHIKYEPTYFVGTINGHEEVVDLIDNRLELETDHANVIKTYNTLQSLKESISNFDKIEIGAVIYDGTNETNAVTKVINVRDIEYLGDLSTAKYQISLNTLTAQGSWFANVVFNFSDDKNIRIVRTAVDTPANLWNTIIITHIRGIRNVYSIN